MTLYFLNVKRFRTFFTISTLIRSHFLGALRSENQLIHFQEGFDECLFEVITLVVVVLLQLFDEMLLNEFGHFSTTMAIKNAKHRDVLSELSLRDGGILHRITPPY
jgi:hypothetical protein